MVIYDIVNIIGPLFTHFGLVSCLCLNQWPLAFLMTPSDWTMSCHVLIMDDGRGWKHHRGTHKFLCRMDNFSGIYFNYIDINYIYINGYFKLHARAPSADVPRWGDKRIDATWQHRPGSTIAQIMACCLTSPSHYLNQRWLFVKGFVWHSAESNFIQHAHALNP